MPRIATRCIACDNPALDRQSAVLMPFVARRALGWTSCEVTPEWGLRDLPTGHAHALCSSLHCGACGMLFLDMRFDDDEMARLYYDYRGLAYEAERESFEPGYAMRNRRLIAGDPHIPAVEEFLRPFLPSQPAVLDWGGDTGLNTPLRKTARVHHVLDISGKPLVDGATAISEQALSYTRHDLVVLSNVLEHVPEPRDLLARVAGVLGTGRLYVEVPFEPLMRAKAGGDEEVWRRKRHWHEHVNFFSVPALHSVLTSAGLQLVSFAEIDLPGPDSVKALGLICCRS